jgi:hypothetical protein
MDQNASLVVAVISGATDMRPPIDYKYFFVKHLCHALGDNRTGKTRAYH